MKENSSVDLQFVDIFRKQIFENEVMLAYRGEISQDIILALLDMTEKKLGATREDQTIKSKIFKVMVGCLQNIASSSDINKHAKSNMFLIGKCELGYTIFSGNAIRKDKITNLKEKLLKISGMTEAELKEFYYLWLQSREITEEQGVGMGLIDIARKTGNNLDFDFFDIDNDYSYFSLKTMVKTKN
jgi:hypothetical protein